MKLTSLSPKDLEVGDLIFNSPGVYKPVLILSVFGDGYVKVFDLWDLSVEIDHASVFLTTNDVVIKANLK